MKEIAKFDAEDVDQYKSFKVILNNSQHSIKGDAVFKYASLFVWFEKLGDKIEGALKRQALEEAERSKPKIKPVREKK